MTIPTFITNNITNKSEEALDYLNFISLFIYCVAFVMGVIGNGLVIYVTGFKMKTTVNAVWFLNLALADFLFTLFLIFSIVNICRNFDWPFGDFMCKFNSLVAVLNMYASIFLLTAISLDRCLCTWVVVWAQNKRTLCKARLICLLIWLASLACSLPYGILRETWFYPTDQKTFCVYSSSFSASTSRDLIVFRFVVGFLLPFLIITGSYVAIGVRARRLQRKRKLKPFRVILAVILAFFCCWLPFHIYQFLDNSMYHAEEREEDISQAYIEAMNVAAPLTTSLAFLNSCLNPILYVFMTKDFQKKLKQSVLLVLESAFTEENLAFFTSRYSVSSRHSESQGPIERKDTLISLVTPSDKGASTEE